MKLATRKNGTRDGELLVVSHDGTRCVSAAAIAPSLLSAMDDWEATSPALRTLAQELEAGSVASEPVVLEDLLAPLPRTWEWLDGSAFINHVVLVRRARNAEPPATLMTDPLVYQGGSSEFLPPTAPLEPPAPGLGLDFESEIGVILGDTPIGCAPEEVPVRLLVLLNDVTLRNIIPGELKKGFGFVTSKPATAFAPFAVTPDELGQHWRDQRLHLPVTTYLNDAVVGHVHAGNEMHFSFGDLVSHVARTRRLGAGTVFGSGTVSTTDPTAGVSCLAEARMREIIEHGEARTPFLEAGDLVKIEVRDDAGDSVFGAIEQRVLPALSKVRLSPSAQAVR